VTDPSHTLSDVPDEGDPATSRTTTPEHAPAQAPMPERSAEAGVEPRAADTSSSAVDNSPVTSVDSASSASSTSSTESAESAVASPSPSQSPSPFSALGFPEGEPQSLHPAHLRTQLIGHWITVGVMSFAAFTILSSLTVGGALRGVRLAVVPGLAATVITLIAWWGWRYQHLEHRRTSYVISAAGCEIRRGVVWRRIITVPLSRIQHTDVTQGPLQRAYGLATLALYTAGTEHAKVDLSGLSFETAMAIRQYLFERSEAHDHSHHAAR
jgi:membrane protein YdbS with pleckstrin-like domain